MSNIHDKYQLMIFIVRKNISKWTWHVMRFEVSKFGIKILKRYRLLWAPSILIYWTMNPYADSIFTDFHTSRYSSCPDVVWEGKWANGERKPVKPKKYKLENMSSNSFFAFVVFHLVKYNRLWSTISESNQLNVIIKFLKLYVWLYGHFINDDSALKSSRWKLLYLCINSAISLFTPAS